MGAEFVWRRAMTRLRSTMANLGPEFIAEMTRRDEIAQAASIENYLTDHDTIRLAEALGVVSSTGAMRLRHAYEIVMHFASGETEDEEMPAVDAISIIRTCVQYALGEEHIGVAVDFTRFRARLLGEPLAPNDAQVEQLVEQPPFFLSTALRVLLAAIRRDTGARQQHALSNLGVLLPLLWPQLPEADRWSIGELYAEASSSGASTVILDLKRTLLKVRGFDYVPESLRSSTFKKAAQAVIEAHFAMNNFYNEGPVIQQLASLGTIIPKPATAECIRAYLCVYLGNMWGVSFTAAPIAAGELRTIPATVWEYYFKEVFKDDEVILEKLTLSKPQYRFVQLMSIANVPLSVYPRDVASLLEAARSGKSDLISGHATRLLGRYKTVN